MFTVLLLTLLIGAPALVFSRTGHRLRFRRFALRTASTFAMLVATATAVMAQSHGASATHHGGEANLALPNLANQTFLGLDGHTLLLFGLVICFLGLVFGFVTFLQLKNLPVHRSMRDISELIYETCKTYLVTQCKFILILEAFIAIVIVLYFGFLSPPTDPNTNNVLRVVIILVFSLIGIAGSYGVAWFGIRVNTFANSRTAFAGLAGKPYPIYTIPLRAGMSIGMMLISVELLIMLCILLFLPRDYAGPCFIGFAIGESLGAAALRIAGGIFTKIADIGSDLMKIVFKIKEDDARNPGVIADCTGDNAGDSVGPSADGFETYGVTGVALITFILLGVPSDAVKVQLLVWIFVMRVVMIIASAFSYFVNEAIAKARYAGKDEMNFESPLTSLVWITSIVSVVHIHRLVHDDSEPRRWEPLVEARDHHHLRHARRRDHPRTRQGLHLDRIGARQRSRHLFGRGRPVFEHPFGTRRRKLLGLLARHEHRYPDGHRLLLHYGRCRGRRGPRRFDGQPDCRADLRLRPRRVRLPRHGARDDCC